MDNNFYEKSSPGRRKNEENNQNVMTKIIVVQLILSLLVSGIIFGVCRTESELSKNIKNFYKDICKTDIAVSTIFGELKNVVKQTFSPNVIEEATIEEINETGEE